MWLSKVVLPAPRKPDSTVTGSRACGGGTCASVCIMESRKSESRKAQSQRRSGAGWRACRAFAMQLDVGMPQGKAVVPRPVVQAVPQLFIDELVHMAASVTDGESRHAVVATRGMRTAHIGVHRLQPMDQPPLGQLVQGAVDLGGGAQALAPKLVEQRIGGEWGRGLLEGVEHPLLVGGQWHGDFLLSGWRAWQTFLHAARHAFVKL
ncbi:hypothetical protein SDC9_156397 [bioreactor metagenome]|uniref:Uncharacterized protein n=1 Tax=bioreactor metagenome TaxID=1076179 RepID=A0A645F6Y4_9ZZZZ